MTDELTEGYCITDKGGESSQDNIHNITLKYFY